MADQVFEFKIVNKNGQVELSHSFKTRFSQQRQTADTKISCNHLMSEDSFKQLPKFSSLLTMTDPGNHKLSREDWGLLHAAVQKLSTEHVFNHSSDSLFTWDTEVIRLTNENLVSTYTKVHEYDEFRNSRESTSTWTRNIDRDLMPKLCSTLEVADWSGILELLEGEEMYKVRDATAKIVEAVLT